MRNEGHAVVRHKDWHRCAHSRVFSSRKEDHELHCSCRNIGPRALASVAAESNVNQRRTALAKRFSFLGNSCTVKKRISSTLFVLLQNICKPSMQSFWRKKNWLKESHLFLLLLLLLRSPSASPPLSQRPPLATSARPIACMLHCSWQCAAPTTLPSPVPTQLHTMCIRVRLWKVQWKH